MKTVAFFLLICTLLALPAFAAETASGLEGIAAPSALLMAPDGTVLFEKDAHTRREPASVTKIMTLLLTFEALEKGSITLDDVVTATEHACAMGGSQIWMRQEERFTVRELIKCVAIASANDCAVLLGEHIAGTEEAFVIRMNERAQQLGMTGTRFVNCCGLPAQGHLTSAYDIGLMTCALMRHEAVFEYTTVWMDTIRDGAFGLTNTNKLLKSYEGITGMKTGFTSSAGYCISATAKREELHLIAVVMGEQDTAARNRDVAALLNYGFANYTVTEIRPEQPVMQVPVRRGKADRVLCTMEARGPLLLGKEQAGNLALETVLPEYVDAPVAAGQPVGELVVRCGEQELTRIPIVAGEDVAARTLKDCLQQLLSHLFCQK